MRATALLVLAGLLAGRAPAAAQAAVVADAPLAFGIAWGRGTPQGDFADVVDAPQGFVAWLSLPVTRRSRLGIRGEFSILTLPEQTRSVPYVTPGATIALDVVLRGTLAFTGAGPRLALGLGPLQLGVAGMVGVVRGINDLTAQASVGDRSLSDAVSLSDFTVGVKGVLDAYLPLYRGARGTSIGLAGGVSWFTGGPVEFARRSSLAIDEQALLRVDRQVAHPTMLVVRAGVGAAF